jgi:F-type H+-transporting ATPase subunit epsilon
MKTFTLRLYDTVHCATRDDVVSFVGEDASGGFGLLAGHARFTTCLVFGLARFRGLDETWNYIAMPGGVLYFVDNVLSISTRHFIVDADHERISDTLHTQLLEEESQLQDLKKSLHNMEGELFKRLWEASHRL